MNFHSSDFANTHRWFFDLEFVRTRNKNAENLSDDAIIESILDPGNQDPYAPNVLFDAEHCSTALGVTRNLENVVLRYLQEGMRRGVSPNPLFDPSFYLSQCTHLLQNPSAAIEDCLNRVRRNERLPCFHPFFDEDFICKDCDFGAPAAFYSALFGGDIYEVRSHALVDFDHLGHQLNRTFESYREALAAYWDAEHDVSTHVLFDLDFYRAQLGKDTDIRRGVYHYLVSNTQHSPQPLFDPSFYRQAAKETFGQLPERPYEHYVQQGQYCGLDPSPFFDTQHYSSQTNCEDAPLEHFLRDGHLSASGHALLRFAQSRLHAAASNHSDTAVEALLATEP
ncbi:hypothetical protein, partial [Planktotalea sp.]|uniref:hypothetical protein n=1 Tax=Planktotalea sp. TaxID=2029877 RepID=UPI0032999112